MKADSQAIKGIKLAAIGALAILVLGAAPAHADDDDRERSPFTERSLEGYWGWSGDGKLVIEETGESVPTVGLGTIYFDGHGGCSVTSYVNINGEAVEPVTSSECFYLVNPDGTGRSEAVFSDPPFEGIAPVVFVIVDKGKEIRFVQNNRFVVTFIAKRI